MKFLWEQCVLFGARTISGRHLGSAMAATALAVLVATSLFFLAAETYKHVSGAMQWSNFFRLATGQLSLQNVCYRGFGSYQPSAIICVASYHYYIANLLLSPISIGVIALLSWLATYWRPAAAIAATATSYVLAAILIYISPFADNSFYVYALKAWEISPKNLNSNELLLLPNAIAVEVIFAWLVTYLLWTVTSAIACKQGLQ